MLGCAPNVIEENKLIQTIDSLDMNIFSKKGDKIYSITSPDLTYDNSELKFDLKKPTVKIFKGEKTKYIIVSEDSTLTDNNRLINMSGNVKLRTINQDEDFLYADNFIWNINETKYLLEGNIRFENQNSVCET